MLSDGTDRRRDSYVARLVKDGVLKETLELGLEAWSDALVKRGQSPQFAHEKESTVNMPYARLVDVGRAGVLFGIEI